MADVRLIDAKQHHLRLSKKSMGDLFPDWHELPKDVQDKLCKLAKEHERELFNAPTVDAAPVVHGRWEKHKTMHGFVYCSACRDVYLDAEWLADGKWTYCPNCGAKMDLEVPDGKA